MSARNLGYPQMSMPALRAASVVTGSFHTQVSKERVESMRRAGMSPGLRLGL